MKWRYFIIIGVITISYIFLVYNIYDLQLNNGEFYSAQAQYQNNVSGILESERGSIYFTDKNNNLIQAVLNKNYSVIFAVPKKIQDEINKLDDNLRESQLKEILKKISLILNISIEDLEKKFNKKNDLYELLAQKASNEQVNQINELGIKGIYVNKQKLRFYSFGKLASHLIGFVSPTNDKEITKYGNIQIGRYGLELEFNNLLMGQAGSFNNNKIIKSENGKDLILTIDRNIQAQSEEILKKLVDKWSAVGGSIIIQDPKSGKILSMASFPDFDPNNYSESEIKNFLNPAVQSIYEPGSVFKLITMAIGMDSGKITPETTYVDSGSITLNGKTIRNWDLKAYGKQTMSNVIEHSINTGSVYAERKIGHDIFYNYLIKFGFNELTDINLPGEVRGNINNLKNGKEIDFATASFGQGVAVTPIRLISAISIIANDGVLMKPLILANDKPEVARRVISKDASNKVANMMVSAVKKNIIAGIPNYNIAGKTGTAFIPDFKNGGYDTNQVIHTYVGFAPANDPKFVILIKLDKPSAPLAGQTVVPAFRELTQYILNYYNVAPDDMGNNL